MSSRSINAAAPSLAPGAVFAGKYRVVRELGRGGVGVVVEAEHVRLRQRFAIKILDSYFVRESSVVERFEREARGMASLKSPYVTSVTDVDTLPDGTPYMVMELLQGRDLSAELRERSVLPTAEAISLAIQACEGLEVVHAAGIIHRDLKPSNLFLVPTERGVIVKVMDFGISKFEGNEVTRTGSSLGTPAYMSPEQVRSPRDVDARADLWSLGVILFRALSGTLPFEGEGITGMSVAIVNDAPKRLAELRPDLPSFVIDLVNGLLSKDRNERLPNATAVRDALTVAASQLETHPTDGPPPHASANEHPHAVLDSFVRPSSSWRTTPPPVVDPSVNEANADLASVPVPAPPLGSPADAAPRASHGLLIVAFVSGFLTLVLVAAFFLLQFAGAPAAEVPSIPPASAPSIEVVEPAPVPPMAVIAAPSTSAASASPPSSAVVAPKPATATTPSSRVRRTLKPRPSTPAGSAAPPPTTTTTPAMPLLL